MSDQDRKAPAQGGAAPDAGIADSPRLPGGTAMLGEAVVGLGLGVVQRRLAQRRAQREPAPPGDVHQAAEQGLQGSPLPLPHGDAIQRSFGPHDLGGVQSFVGGPAAAASECLGAAAYATGSAVAFREAPDLHTAAHEAAHVIQQRGGVQLSGGLGQEGDHYERHADAVAERVVQGHSAEDLLDGATGSGAPSPGAVQRFADKHNEARRDKAEETIGEKQGQLDHAVSQDTIKALVDTLDTLGVAVEPKKTRYVNAKPAFEALQELLDEMAAVSGHQASREKLLLNMRTNLTPGYKLTTGNPGNDFDPQVSMKDNVVASTGASDRLAIIDQHARTLGRLVNFLPAS